MIVYRLVRLSSFTSWSGPGGSYRLGDNTFVALAQTLVSTDFHILPFPLFHECLKLCVVIFRDRFGRHLSHTSSAIISNVLLNLFDRVFEGADARALFQTL